MDRPPPRKRYHSDSDSDDEILPYIKQDQTLGFPFMQSIKNFVPDITQNIFDSKTMKKRKIADNFQLASMFPNQQNSLLVSVKNFLKCLDTEEVLSALSILSSELAIAQEPVLLSIPMGKVLEGLMKCLNSSVSDVVLLCMNSLLTLIEVASNYAPLLVNIGALPILISKLDNFSYIDIAEKAIKIIEKISKFDPSSILHHRVFQITMETLDFYELETQKSIICIGINILSVCNKENLSKTSIDSAFLKVFDYVSSPVSEKVLEFIDLFLEKIPQNSYYIKSIGDQGFILILNQLLSTSTTSQSRIFSIYKSLVKFDSIFACQIYTSNTLKLMEKLLTIGNSIEITEVLQILCNTFEHIGVDYQRFQGLIT